MDQFDPPAGGMPGVTVVLLNGPPRSGKDTAGAFLAKSIPNSAVVKFAGPLKHMTHIAYGLPPGIPDAFFEQSKDAPLDAFFGLTPRQAYIKMSEEQTKPFLGPNHFGKLLRRSIWRDYCAGKRVFFVTDSGFAPEANPVIDNVGEDNVLLVRIHAEQRGVSFAGDSRSYIELPRIASCDIYNNASVEEFEVVILRLIERFVFARQQFTTSLLSVS